MSWSNCTRAVKHCLAESLAVPDFVGMMKGTKNGELKAQQDDRRHTEDQEEYYSFDQSGAAVPALAQYRSRSPTTRTSDKEPRWFRAYSGCVSTG